MKYIFVGQNVMGAKTLEGLLSDGKMPEMVITRPSSDYENQLETLARSYNIPLRFTENINKDTALLDEVKQIAPDLMYCSAWGNILKEHVLSLPKLGWVNFHPSLLPYYRGSSPICWQIKNGEEYSGCTAHFMVLKFDEGNIIAQEKIKIDILDDADTLKQKCGEVLGSLALIVYNTLDKDPGFKGTPQNIEKGSYYPPRSSEEVVDLTKTALQNYNHIRAMRPFPFVWGPQALFHYKIVRATVSDIKADATKPLLVKDGKAYLACSDVYLCIDEVSIDKKTISDYLPLTGL